MWITIDKRNINLQLKNGQILILEDFVVHKKDVFCWKLARTCCFMGAAITVPFSVYVKRLQFSSLSVQTLGLRSFTETAECLDDFETAYLSDTHVLCSKESFRCRTHMIVYGHHDARIRHPPPLSHLCGPFTLHLVHPAFQSTELRCRWNFLKRF